MWSDGPFFNLCPGNPICRRDSCYRLNPHSHYYLSPDSDCFQHPGKPPQPEQRACYTGSNHSQHQAALAHKNICQPSSAAYPASTASWRSNPTPKADERAEADERTETDQRAQTDERTEADQRAETNQRAQTDQRAETNKTAKTDKTADHWLVTHRPLDGGQGLAKFNTEILI